MKINVWHIAILAQSNHSPDEVERMTEKRFGDLHKFQKKNNNIQPFNLYKCGNESIKYLHLYSKKVQHLLADWCALSMANWWSILFESVLRDRVKRMKWISEQRLSACGKAAFGVIHCLIFTIEMTKCSLNMHTRKQES